MGQEEVWDAIAGKWAKFRDKPTEEVIAFLSGKKGRVLDLGCGSGRHFLDIEGLEFYGVDFSEELLGFAREKGYVETKKARVSAIPYGDSFFDYVVFSRVLHCVEGRRQRQESLEEVYRVLRKGGEALIITWSEKGRKRLKGNKEGFVPWGIDGEKIMRYTYIYDAEELREELVGAGFEHKSLDEGWNIVAVVRKS